MPLTGPSLQTMKPHLIRWLGRWPMNPSSQQPPLLAVRQQQPRHLSHHLLLPMNHHRLNQQPVGATLWPTFRRKNGFEGSTKNKTPQLCRVRIPSLPYLLPPLIPRPLLLGHFRGNTQTQRRRKKHYERSWKSETRQRLRNQIIPPHSPHHVPTVLVVRTLRRPQNHLVVHRLAAVQMPGLDSDRHPFHLLLQEARAAHEYYQLLKRRQCSARNMKREMLAIAVNRLLSLPSSMAALRSRMAPPPRVLRRLLRRRLCLALLSSTSRRRRMKMRVFLD